MSCVQGEPWTDQRIISCLKWAAARMGSATTTMTLDLTVCELWPWRLYTCEMLKHNHIIAATSKKKPLNNLRCLTLRLLHSPDGYHCPRAHYEEDILEHFLWWLLADVPCLEALCLRRDTSLYYSLAVVGLDCLKHLELQTIRPLDVVCLAKTRLLVLETLCINGRNPTYSAVGSIDVAGYECLRQLALRNITLPHVIRRSSCQLNCHMNIMCSSNESADWGLVNYMLNSAEQVELYSKNSCSFGVDGMFACMPRTQVLTMSGQVLKQLFLLTRCITKSGLPVEGLRVLVLHADNIHCWIPAGFPNLEELVVKAKENLKLSFVDPVRTFSILKSFHAFGEPLTTDGSDPLLEMQFTLMKRGLCVEAVRAVTPAAGRGFSRHSNGLYMRPLNGRKLSIGALYDIVSQRAKNCSCGACFTCLRSAGHIE